ncbi:hypothetical protein [Clostridium sp. C2-6-12]|uniref:hypothetical protein n=1 Tax=Clostridium sp. C2-6-12 TaxID=2698832 RepID=UPI00136A3886|nr:hypothetical protein [Clostridium sp. C2-6-12]
MPFNFTSYKHYSVNYSNLFDELNSNKFLNDSTIQSKYLESWINTLKNSDNIITEQLKTPDSIKNLIVLLSSEPEIFQLPITYGDNELFIHFRASIANQIIPSGTKGEHIPLNEFTKSNSSIHWTPVDENVDSYSDSKEPIIMVPFLNGQHNSLVIDGNHRVTYNVKNNIDNITEIIISEQSVIDFSLFSSGFDKMLYIMHNELNHMANATHRENANAIDLIKKSYLVDKKFKFI